MVLLKFKRVSQVHSFSSMLSQNKGIVADYLPWVIIAVLVLAVLMISIFLLQERGIVLIDRIKDLLRLR